MSEKKKKARTLAEADIELRRSKRPENYSQLSAEQRQKIDEKLDLIDKDTGITLL